MLTAYYYIIQTLLVLREYLCHGLMFFLTLNYDQLFSFFLKIFLGAFNNYFSYIRENNVLGIFYIYYKYINILV